MPSLHDASPRLTVHLFKTIDRQTVDGNTAVSTRYAGKDPYVDLTPFLGDGSSVRTSKSVREPAGGFSISFMDKAQKDWPSTMAPPGFQSLESVYGLVEPMDVIEIRMWNGMGEQTGMFPIGGKYPIIMRGFVSDVQRGQSMGENGQPQRVVTITGQDYGKIWQMYQVLFLPAYADGKPLLTSYALSELFGIKVVNSMPAGEFVRTMIEKIINPFLAGFLPDTMPADIVTKIQTGESISVKHGVVNVSQQNMQGSVYNILKFHGDVGVWNELYTEDREDGVHCVYRAIPALHLTTPSGTSSRKIQDDAPDPIYVEVPDDMVQSLSVARTDANVANFFWVNNSKFDLIDDMSRKLFAISQDSSSVSLKDYPNTAVKYYGVRPMYAETQQGGDEVKNQGSGLDEQDHNERSARQESWIEKRRRTMMEMNRDNVVFERGTARIKGGPMRPGDDGEAMKAGDYVTFVMGNLYWDAYVYQIDHEFNPYQGYTTILYFERGEGFVTRMAAPDQSPWLSEQVRRR